MKLHRVVGLALAIQLCAVLSAFGQGNYKAEAIGAAPADVPASLSRALSTPRGFASPAIKGQRSVKYGCARLSPPIANPNTSSDVLFGALAEGAFVGVVHFPNPTTDFRSQTIKPGYYTLRYALIPQDGNHMGVNPYRDAFHLGPVSADTDPDKTLTFDELVKIGRLASGTPHPAFLVGAQVTGTTFPSVVKDDSGHWNLQVMGHASSGNLPLAITVVGHFEG